MSSVFKTLLTNDVTQTRTLLHEFIPITGSIVSGTYSDNNIKNYAHGMFQSVYDYPYLSSSANHIFDLTVGYSPNSSFNDNSSVQNVKKVQLYNQMAQVLVGHDVVGNILEFDADGDLLAGGVKLREVVFVNFARLLTKDEVKKGNFRFTVGEGAVATPFSVLEELGDYGAQNDFRTNSPAGEYAPLYTSSINIVPDSGVGLYFYQAGVAVLTASLFSGSADMLASSSIEAFCDDVRRRWYNMEMNNTVELNSSIYFCRVNNNEFNYSSNPTYLSGSKIRVKSVSTDAPVSYITSVGLYGADNTLLATAKLSEPLKKTVDSELILRVRLDY